MEKKKCVKFADLTVGLKVVAVYGLISLIWKIIVSLAVLVLMATGAYP